MKKILKFLTILNFKKVVFQGKGTLLRNFQNTGK